MGSAMFGTLWKILFFFPLNDARIESLKFNNLRGLHLYNLRKSKGYRRRRGAQRNTCARTVCIGERRKPQPHGGAGYLRVDTVHQGDWDGHKGVYHINAVDQICSGYNNLHFGGASASCEVSNSESQNESIENGTVIEIDGVKRVYFDRYWIRYYKPPEETLTAKNLKF